MFSCIFTWLNFYFFMRQHCMHCQLVTLHLLHENGKSLKKKIVQKKIFLFITTISFWLFVVFLILHCWFYFFKSRRAFRFLVSANFLDFSKELDSGKWTALTEKKSSSSRGLPLESLHFSWRNGSRLTSYGQKELQDIFSFTKNYVISGTITKYMYVFFFFFFVFCNRVFHELVILTKKLKTFFSQYFQAYHMLGSNFCLFIVSDSFLILAIVWTCKGLMLICEQRRPYLKIIKKKKKKKKANLSTLFSLSRQILSHLPLQHW